MKTLRIAAFAAGLAFSLAGCLFEPKIGDQWTRFDITEPSPETRSFPDTLRSMTLRGSVTYRAIRTGSLIAEIRVSDSIGYADVHFDPKAPRRQVLLDVERLLANSRSVGITGVLATGWDRLIREVTLTVPCAGGLSHGPDGGVFLLFYMGDAIREEQPDGSETVRFEPFDFEAQEILPTAIALRTEAPASPAAGARGLSASAAPVRPTLSVGGGVTLPDRHLADYQWAVDPRTTWQGDVGLTQDDWGGGVAVRRWGTTQAVAASAAGSVAVRLTSVTPRVERRLARSGGTSLEARAGFGALRLDYGPETLRLATDSGPVDVHFRPLWTWQASAGLGMRQALSPALALRLDLERSLYPLDTTHRVGSEFVNRREYFGGWTVGGRLTWYGGSF